MERIDDLNIKGRKVIQNTDYFLFGMDTVLLANTAKCKAQDIVMDFCTGSAVIPILLDAKCKCKKIIGVELQPEMYDLAKRNVELNNVQDKIDILNMDIAKVKEIRKYLLENYNTESVSVITCNPPYKEVGTGLGVLGSVKEIAKNEVKCNLDMVFKSAASLLKSHGKLYMVHKPERIVDLICVARKYNMELKTMRLMQPSVNKRASLVLLEYVKDGGNECKIEPTIIEYGEDGKYTKDILEMYVEGVKEK